jgi:uncharacterized protein YycO
MIDRVKVPSAYRLICILLIGIEVSCVSLQQNYLVGRTDWSGNPIPNRAPSEIEKRILQRKADSLLVIITEQKKREFHLRATQINQLYSVFGEQLNNDQYYHEVLQKNKIKTDSLSPEQYRAALELLSSAENYERSYQKNRMVRRSLNRGDRGNNIPREVLWKSNKFLYNPTIRRDLGINFMRYYNQQTDSIFNQLPKTNTCIALRKSVFHKNDRLHSCIYNIVYGGSYVVGNTIGLFHQTTNRQQNADLLRSVLQPFDIVLMKSPHHLTDQFIPGYFGHVGIWLGSRLAAGLKEKVAAKDSIKDKAVVEVLRSGVKISTLKDFSDGEIFLVIRPRNLSNELKETIISNVQKQLGKDYDFNFDIESPEAITCTELVYLAYDFVDWQIRYTWSRYTLSPDDLALTALKNLLFEFPAFIENGVITANPNHSVIRSLVGEPEPLSSQ